jgi:hypothetical protein
MSVIVVIVTAGACSAKAKRHRRGKRLKRKGPQVIGLAAGICAFQKILPI